MLCIKNLQLCVHEKVVLTDFSIAMKPGQVQLIVGPNGSGKSSLVHFLRGDVHYKKKRGTVTFLGISLDTMSVVERVQKGLFIVTQHQIEIPGLKVSVFLKATYEALVGQITDLDCFFKKIVELFIFVGLDGSFLERCVHDGFSGGQKKRFELVQILLLRPKCIVLDEIDSGLDAAGCQVLLAVLNNLMNEKVDRSVLLITHRPELFQSICNVQIYQMKVASEFI